MNAYVSAILQGAVLTVGVSVAALLVSVVLGLLGPHGHAAAIRQIEFA